MKIKEGKFYKTRDGRKVGPLRRLRSSCLWDVTDDENSNQNTFVWASDGKSHTASNLDIVSEWYTSCSAAQVDVQREEYGPIRTRREIVPGMYGCVKVGWTDGETAFVSINEGEAQRPLSSDDISEAIHILSQIREVLEENQ